MTSHRAYNPGGPMPLASDNAETARAKFAAAGQPLPEPDPPPRAYTAAGQPIPENDPPPIVFKENPPRASEMVRCPLPNISAFARNATRRALEEFLLSHFNGFTSYPMLGGWNSAAGFALERGIIYEVSYDAAYRDRHQSVARNAFLRAGAEMGEEWTRIEIHQFQTHCAKTNLSAGEREQKELWDAIRRRQRCNSAWAKNT